MQSAGDAGNEALRAQWEGKVDLLNIGDRIYGISRPVSACPNLPYLVNVLNPSRVLAPYLFYSSFVCSLRIPLLRYGQDPRHCYQTTRRGRSNPLSLCISQYSLVDRCHIPSKLSGGSLSRCPPLNDVLKRNVTSSFFSTPDPAPLCSQKLKKEHSGHFMVSLRRI